MLEIKDLVTGYGDLKVLDGVSLTVEEGETVALVGSNGAGKTTLLQAISGLLPVWSGDILFRGQSLPKLQPHQLPALGIAHIPQGRGILARSSVYDNLMLGGYIASAKAKRSARIEEMYSLFPILSERRTQLAGTLSGGEQQMLAIARALMMYPSFMILDEPSLGLSPLMVETVFKIIGDVSNMGVSILIIEQNLVEALHVADRGYVLETGRVVLEGTSEELMGNAKVREAYLGI
jgi:branched-chain amino acid transport system ATP-binding protein